MKNFFCLNILNTLLFDYLRIQAVDNQNISIYYNSVMDILSGYAYNTYNFGTSCIFLYSLNCSIYLGRYMIGWKGEIDVESKQIFI
jgi:hypothetical protein